MQQLIRNFHFFLLRQKGITIICGALVLTGILWWFDYVSGYETTFSSFYLIPIALTVVYVNMGAVFSITALCLAVWVISN